MHNEEANDQSNSFSDTVSFMKFSELMTSEDKYANKWEPNHVCSIRNMDFAEKEITVITATIFL